MEMAFLFNFEMYSVLLVAISINKSSFYGLA